MDGFANYYHVPRACKRCKGVMVYKGVGEYKCEDCGFVDYDDYGKVRLYIEEHHGATAAEIEAAVGVSQKTIRQMLRESRIEIAEGSRSFIHCEICGKEIRSGRYCPECEAKVHLSLEAEQRELHRRNEKGYGRQEEGDEGHRRFMRER